MQVTRNLIAILFLIGCFYSPLMAQNISDSSNFESLRSLKVIDNDTTLQSLIILENLSRFEYNPAWLFNRFAIRHTDNQEKRTNPVPVIVFGFTGMFLGAWVGHSIDHKEHMAGEFPEIFTKGTLVGGGIGLMTGATIGYFLGKNR